jgi:hypothetical protein
MYIPYDSNHRALAQKFGFGIEQASHTLDQKQIHDHLDSQSRYAHIYYNWNKIAMQWTTFLKGVISAKSQ